MPPKPVAVANVTRRTWDKDHYDQKASDRAEYGDDFVDRKHY